MKRAIASLLKNALIKTRPATRNIRNCVHCGRPFEHRGFLDSEPIIECNHTDEATEYIFRYPSTWRVKIVRQNCFKQITAQINLEFCEFCFIMQPKFVGLRIESSCVIHYIWEDQRGAHYELYNYGD